LFTLRVLCRDRCHTLLELCGLLRLYIRDDDTHPSDEKFRFVSLTESCLRNENPRPGVVKRFEATVIARRLLEFVALRRRFRDIQILIQCKFALRRHLF
jgi:hypothetical protein